MNFVDILYMKAQKFIQSAGSIVRDRELPSANPQTASTLQRPPTHHLFLRLQLAEDRHINA